MKWNHCTVCAHEICLVHQVKYGLSRAKVWVHFGEIRRGRDKPRDEPPLGSDKVKSQDKTGKAKLCKKYKAYYLWTYLVYFLQIKFLLGELNNALEEC